MKPRGPLTWLSARTWRFWLFAAIALPVLYVASFGPACWLASRNQRDYSEGPLRPVVVSGDIWRDSTIEGTLVAKGPHSYRPLLFVASRNRLIGDGLRWYAQLGADADTKPVFFEQEIQWASPSFGRLFDK
jgi:hypothetical protein